MTDFAPTGPTSLQRPKTLGGYNPVGSSQSTFKPLVQGQDDEETKRPAQSTARPTNDGPTTVQPQRTFAQMQAAGEARPAPPPPPQLPPTAYTTSAAGGVMNMRPPAPPTTPSLAGGVLNMAVPTGQLASAGPHGSTLPSQSGVMDALPRRAPLGPQQTTIPSQSGVLNAPPPPQGQPFGGTPGAPYSGQLSQTISQALANPSAYGTPQVMQAFDRMSADIDDDFTRRQGQLKEEMARRGLSDSTVNSGRGYELNVEKRSARTDLADRLMQQMAQTYGADRAAAIAAGLQGASQANANNLDWARLGQQGEQFGQDLQLRSQLGLGELGLGQQRLGLDTQTQLGQLGLAGRDQTLREQMGLGELDLNKQRLGLESGDLDLRRQLGLGNLDLSRQQLSENSRQSDLDRQLRSQLGLGELDLNRQQLTQQGQQFDKDLGLRQELGRGELGLNQQKLGFDQQNSNLDRQLRERLGLGELDINQQRTNNDLSLGQNQLLGSVFNALMNGNVDLSALPPGILDQVMGRISGGGSGGSGGGGTTTHTNQGPWWKNYPNGGGSGTGTPGVDTGAGGGMTQGGGSPVATGSSPSMPDPTYQPQGRDVTPEDLRPGPITNGYILGGKWYPDQATALYEQLMGQGGVGSSFEDFKRAWGY